MTFNEIQQSVYILTEQEVRAVSRRLVQSYRAAIDEIKNQLRRVYADILSGYPAKEYYNVMSKYNRLRRLTLALQEQYIVALRDAERLTPQAAELSIRNVFYRQMYTLNFAPDVEQLFQVLNPAVIEASVYGTTEAWENIRSNTLERVRRTYGDINDYLPQSGTLLRELIVKRRPQVLADIESTVRQSLIQGESFRGSARRLQDVMNNSLNNALRIIRTESHRNQNIGNLALTRVASANGVEVRRQIVSVLDDRTRPQSAQVDGQIENDRGLFVYPGGVEVRTPGNSGVPGWDINDRESVINIVPGMERTMRRGRDPVTGETSIITWQSFDQWRRNNNLKTNRYGQIYRS